MGEVCCAGCYTACRLVRRVANHQIKKGARACAGKPAAGPARLCVATFSSSSLALAAPRRIATLTSLSLHGRMHSRRQPGQRSAAPNCLRELCRTARHCSSRVRQGAHSFFLRVSGRLLSARPRAAAVIYGQIHSVRFAVFLRSCAWGTHSGNTMPALYSASPTRNAEESLHTAIAATLVSASWASCTWACARGENIQWASSVHEYGHAAWDHAALHAHDAPSSDNEGSGAARPSRLPPHALPVQPDAAQKGPTHCR